MSERMTGNDHWGYTHTKNRFAKLRRRINAYERSGFGIDQDDYIEMLKLDNKLAVEYPNTWRRNYEESKYIDEVLKAQQNKPTDDINNKDND